MRADNELFKDKVEITLEGRQVFYLFFGGAVIASLVFVLGVMVGKRVEARAHVGDSAGTSVVSDPLAALDQLGGDRVAGPALTYPAELSRPAEPVKAAEPVRDDDADDQAEDKPEAKVAEKAVERKPEPRQKYTLQLSSFRDKAEAEAFMRSVTQAGYDPFITSAEVEGKGTWYRIRLGSYDSYDEALEGKGKFEAAQNMVAYVTRAR